MNGLASGMTLAAQIADRLRDDIICHRIQPGSRITVKEIAEKYNVSSMPVREAMLMLSGEKFLVLNPYRGATVAAVTSELVAQLNDLQCALESLLVELCIRKGYPQEILTQLEAINHEMEQLREDEEGWRENRLRLNVQFHKLEYSPCSDHMAYQQFLNNLNQLAAIRKHYELDSKRVQQTLSEHQLLVEALRNSDIVTAVAVTKLHTLNSKRYALNESFAEAPGEKR